VQSGDGVAVEEGYNTIALLYYMRDELPIAVNVDIARTSADLGPVLANQLVLLRRLWFVNVSATGSDDILERYLDDHYVGAPLVERFRHVRDVRLYLLGSEVRSEVDPSR
jgi:hypothetical protein